MASLRVISAIECSLAHEQMQKPQNNFMKIGAISVCRFERMNHIVLNANIRADGPMFKIIIQFSNRSQFSIAFALDYYCWYDVAPDISQSIRNKQSLKHEIKCFEVFGAMITLSHIILVGESARNNQS